MALQWSRDCIEKLIILIQQRPCLYNIKSSDYLHRTKKAQAMNEVVAELRKSNIFITYEDVKRKWRNLRTQFARERRLICQSQKSGAGRSDVHVPKLWCYDQLEFLKIYSTMRTGKENVEPQNSQRPNLDELGGNSTLDVIVVEEQPQKKFKRAECIKTLQKDLLNFQNILAEKKSKKENKFAWLGSLVAKRMEDIHPDKQAKAAWEIQIVLHKFTSSSDEKENTSTKKDILELSMEGVFDKEDFI